MTLGSTLGKEETLETMGSLGLGCVKLPLAVELAATGMGAARVAALHSAASDREETAAGRLRAVLDGLHPTPLTSAASRLA